MSDLHNHIMQQINSDPFLKLQHELKQFGLGLEYYQEWLGEAAPYKYIVLYRGTHRAYANTLAGVRKALAREKKALKTRDLKEVAELSQLSIFD
jgi:hypothetical protein